MSLENSWLTAAEAAAYLKIRPRTLLKWVREGAIRGYPLHGTRRHVWRFRREDMDSVLGFVTEPMLDHELQSQPSSVVRIQ